MDESALDRLQDELYENMVAAPEKLEEEILDISRDVARKIYFNPGHGAAFEFLGKHYTARYASKIVSFRKVIFLAAVCHEDRKKLEAEAEIDNSLTELENLRGIVSALLHNRAGIIEPGEITE